jgi:hypothetical protein
MLFIQIIIITKEGAGGNLGSLEKLNFYMHLLLNAYTKWKRS